MQETTNTKEPLELGRLIHILSNKIKRRSDYYNISQDTDLTSVSYTHLDVYKRQE